MLGAVVAIVVVLVAYVGWLAIDIVRAAKEYDQTRERLIRTFGLQKPLVFEQPLGYDPAKQDRFDELAPLFLSLPQTFLVKPNEHLANVENSRVATLVLAAKEISHRKAIDFRPVPKSLPLVTIGIRPVLVLLFDFSLGHANSIESLRDALLQTASDLYRPIGSFQLRKYGSVMRICKEINRSLTTTPIGQPLPEIEEVVDSIVLQDSWDTWLRAEASEVLAESEEPVQPSVRAFYQVGNTKSLSSLPLLLPFFFGDTAIKAYSVDHFDRLMIAREKLNGQAVTISSKYEFGRIFAPSKYRGRALIGAAMENFSAAIEAVYVSALAELAIAKQLVALRRQYVASRTLPNSYYEPNGIRFERIRSGFRISCETVRYTVKV